MRGKRKKKLVAMMVAMMVAMKKLVAIGKTGKKNHEKENATMTKMPDTYQCEICSTEGDVADLRGFYGSGGQISFNTVGNCRRHIHQKCLDALVEARAKETKTEKAVSLGRNSFAARSLAEQTLAADQAEPESVKNTCCNCASQFLDTQKHNDFRLMVEAMEIIKAIETLREGGGRLSVHQIDELDPRTSIGVCGDWTHEEWQTFRGDTLHAALAWAVEAMLEKR